MATPAGWALLLPRAASIARWEARIVSSMGEAVGPPKLLVETGAVLRHARTPIGAYARILDRASLLGREDLAPEFRALPRIDLTREGADAARSRAAALGLDLLLALGPTLPARALVGVTRWGAWSFRIGERPDDAVPPAFWELRDGRPFVMASLVRLGTTPAEDVPLRIGRFGVVADSHRATVDDLLGTIAAWPPSVAAESARGDGPRRAAGPSPSTSAVRAANAGDVAAVLTRLARGRARHARDALVGRETWKLGIVDEPIHRFLDPKLEPAVRLVVASPPGRFLADPFGFQTDRGLVVLCEDFDLRTGRGGISMSVVQRDGSGSPLTPLLSDVAHASYPFTLAHDGKRYVVPETQRSGEVALYELDLEPPRLVRRATLLRGVAARDPTLFEHEGRWWLAVSLQHSAGVATLALYHAERPWGPFEPHAGNPVKVDVASARPGGTPFVHEGQLYRPGQDGAGGYGRRVALHRVTTLAPDRFEEELVTHVGPFPDPGFHEGAHTLASVGARTLVDLKGRAFQPRALAGALRRRAMDARIARGRAAKGL